MDRALLNSILTAERLGEGICRVHVLSGACLWEWFMLDDHDYDEVDRLYIDHETMGA